MEIWNHYIYLTCDYLKQLTNIKITNKPIKFIYFEFQTNCIETPVFFIYTLLKIHWKSIANSIHSYKYDLQIVDLHQDGIQVQFNVCRQR